MPKKSKIQESQEFRSGGRSIVYKVSPLRQAMRFTFYEMKTLGIPKRDGTKRSWYYLVLSRY
jgi:hypothetical protein